MAGRGEGKGAFITGATRGLGRSHALRDPDFDALKATVVRRWTRPVNRTGMT